MCTLTIIPARDGLGRTVGYRAVTSRDELRSRPEAVVPSIAPGTEIPACWPTDPLAGGTWIAASASGLALCLLNVNLGDAEPTTQAPRTRGELIPRLIDLPSAEDVSAELRSMALNHYRPFRLVTMTRDGITDARWDRCRLLETTRELEPTCFVSSGLGDHMVEPRLMLFETLFRHSGPGSRQTSEMQDSFHRHVWNRHEHISVMMNRDDARTSSITTVDVGWESPGAAPTVDMTFSDDAGTSLLSLSGLMTPAC